MKDLIAKLEAALEGSRELDFDMALAIGNMRIIPEDYQHSEYAEAYIDGEWECIGSEGQWEDYWLPNWTTSIDAALTLVPEGRYFTLRTISVRPQAMVHCPPRTKLGNHNGEASTPALALCIAALKSH